MKEPFLRSLLILLLISLSACQTTQSVITSPPRTEADLAAHSAELSGDYLSAAQQYLTLATESKKHLQAYYYLRSAQAFWLAGDAVQASNSLSHVDSTLLSTSQQNDTALLEAELSLAESQAEQALVTLERIKFKSLSLSQKQQILRLKIDAYQLTENWLEKANSHLTLSTLLSDVEIAENQQGLWQALMSLTPQSLELFNPGMPPAVNSGWLQLK